MPNLFRLAHEVKMSAEDTAEVMLYGEIIEDIPKWCRWSQEDKSAADFDKAIKEVKEKGARKLLLRINSPGGICTQAVAMRGILLTAGFEEINIRIEGMCASAATDLATLPGAHVSIFEGSEYMIHNPWSRVVGNANDMEKVVERLRNIEQTSRNFYMQKTGQSEDQIKSWMDAETWFTAEQTIEYGFADELIKSEIEAAACVTSNAWDTMKDLYRNIPEQIVVTGDRNPSEEGSEHKEEENKDMADIKDLTPEQINEIQAAAIKAERERVDSIKALTMPGCEQLAEKAIAEGTSVVDYQKTVIEQMKKNGNKFMSQRKEELEPEQRIPGGAPSVGTTEEQMIESTAKEIADLVASMASTNTTMY